MFLFSTFKDGLAVAAVKIIKKFKVGQKVLNHFAHLMIWIGIKIWTMQDFQLYGTILAILFGLLGALLFWKRRSDDGSNVGSRSAPATAGRRRAAVPIRDEDGQVDIKTCI